LVFVSLPALLGTSSTIGLFATVGNCSDSAVAELRYERLGTCACFHSVLLGEVGMAACIMADVWGPVDYDEVERIRHEAKLGISRCQGAEATRAFHVEMQLQAQVRLREQAR
jgi:hypothetical protein